MLKIPGFSSRARSPSPGEGHRHRSRSRRYSPPRERSRSRGGNPSSQLYRDSDSAEDYPRLSTKRPTAKGRYDLSDDERYRSDHRRSRGHRPSQSQYELSDEDREAPRYNRTPLKSDRDGRHQVSFEPGRNLGSASQAIRPPASSRYHEYSDIYTDSDEEGLAYGDSYSDYVLSGSERLPQRHGGDRIPAGKAYDSESSDEYTRRYAREPAARSTDASFNYQNQSNYEQTLHDTYAPGSRDAFATRSQAEQPYVPSQTRYQDKGIDESEWPEIPECERPDFIPPKEPNYNYASAASHKDQQPTPPPAPIQSVTPTAAASQYFFKSAAASDHERPPLHGPQYPIIPPAQYVPPEHYPNMSKPAQTPPKSASPPSQYVSPEHYLKMAEASRHQVPAQHYSGINKSTPLRSPNTLPTARVSGHQRALSTGNAPNGSLQYITTPLQYRYAQPDPNIKYTSKPVVQPATTTSATPIDTQDSNERPGRVDYVEMIPQATRRTHAPRPHSMSTSAVPGEIPMTSEFVGGRPLASPLLEPYHGTYQSISPMPWPAKYQGMEEDFSDLELNGGASGPGKGKDRKLNTEKLKLKHGFHNAEPFRPQKVSLESMRSTLIYNPKGDAKTLKAALTQHKVDPKPLQAILPYLTGNEIDALRAEYKTIVKMTGHGVNLAKHIALRVPGNLGKACHATALGPWESEAYWANFWYRSNSSRRELLIEALTGRTNSEISRIKKCFKDKRYGDSLEKCLKAELKPDKFRAAILLALEGKRQDDMAPLNPELVRSDVQELHRAVVASDGGESVMIQIIMVRGNTHLCEVMRVFENLFGQSLGKAIIKKSKNLVGETLLHVLNGALSRPTRDSLLIHHAIAESGRDRAELLISRLVRMHWDARHMERVKVEYKRKYGKYIEDHIAEKIVDPGAGKSDWAEFCIELVRSSSVHTLDEEYAR
ncbi:hypothetical protein LOZ57_001948 [Ophidiomyces ophidiicola]|uniref:uncharacterized protein n=1 Tax=Ophidiomyces ophidiicola TaxID=1387563 RepID=UPI0020C4696B|nr:uncharacterized protein LOZ57_001948 [Ophidiomyces ophidiicola]KAI1950389.1 hypothetical protein LOZ57_001948 [Ophidiomyces ophidiicola]KAI2063095.1 hypothetical protein LOZ43_000152 [Ophidiomyces ophidiicola]